MGVPMVIDHWFLTLTFLISLAIQATAFLISYTLQFDLITDFSGASYFLFSLEILQLLMLAAVAISYLLRSSPYYFTLRGTRKHSLRGMSSLCVDSKSLVNLI